MKKKKSERMRKVENSLHSMFSRYVLFTPEGPIMTESGIEVLNDFLYQYRLVIKQK